MNNSKIADISFNPFTDSSAEVEKSGHSEEDNVLPFGVAAMREIADVYPCADGRYERGPDGVRFISSANHVTEVCSDIRVLARTRDGVGESWGLLLSWSDPDGVSHTWSLPMQLLQGDFADVRKELSSRGLDIMSAPAGNRLREYLLLCNPDARLRCVNQVGWHGPIYCTPQETIGDAAGEQVVFQAASSAIAECGKSQDRAHWITDVATPSSGNSRLVFAISVALAGPLLKLAGEDSGGFHFLGQSSSGKTTALNVAASVYGDPAKFVRQWRATTNGLEGLAAAHNDLILILDELSQCDPQQAGEAAYMLANGRGKARASQTGSSRPSAVWRILFLSSGESSLANRMESVGKKAQAGQELRLANISADAGAGLGMFECLHGSQDPAAFANSLKEGCNRSYGVVGREWLECLVKDHNGLSDLIADGVREFVADCVPSGASGQVMRVAARFGLVAVAGELASTEFGLTGWQGDEASKACKVCFCDWLDNYGIRNREESSLLAQVRLYLEKHGTSRFQKLDATEKVLCQAGYYRDVDGVRQYLVTPEVFKSEMVAGFNVSWSAGILRASGMLKTEGCRLTFNARIPGRQGTSRVYCLVNGPEVTTCD